MTKYIFLSVLIVVAAGCGGDGGAPDDHLQFGKTVPSETTLCTFTMGVTTREGVGRVLGPPTNFSDNDSGSSVQCCYGNAAIPADFKSMLLGLDESGIFESALFSQIPYSRCWRDQKQQSGQGT